jgi:hypothetical protein
MAIQREWVTPIAVGAFLISAVTGVAIFFHIDTGLAKVAHEWLSWLLLFAVLLHVGANFFGFKRYFSSGKARALMGDLSCGIQGLLVPSIHASRDRNDV